MTTEKEKQEILGDIFDDKSDNDKKKVDDYRPGVGVDIGTSNIVVSRQKKDGTFVNKFHRNMLYPLDVSEEANDLLGKSNYLYVKVGNKYFVVGEDALRMSLALGNGKGIIKPMREGLLNPSLQEASEFLFFIIKAILGDPIVPNEPLRFTVPANSVDKDNDNLFHQIILNNFFKTLGYSPKPVNEAMCIIYDSGATMKAEEGDIPFSGIATSWGAGQVNICMAFRGLSLVEFSCTKSGDNIDEQVEKVTGVSRSKVIKIKETALDLENVDAKDRVQSALSIYYDETISRIIHHIGNKFKEKSSELDGEIEIVIAGGTSMPKGFCKRLEKIIKQSEIPFKVYRVRHAEKPFFSVSSGACIRALADFEKSKKA